LLEENIFIIYQLSIKMFSKVTTKKEALIHLGTITFLFLMIILLFFYVYLPITTNHGEAIKVPDLKGKTIGQTQEILTASSLRYQVSDSSYVVGAIPFSVISQNPEAGSGVKSNRKIYLTIASKNPPMVQMPELMGISFKEAGIRTKNLGLVLLQPNVVSSPFENLVINQYSNGKEIKTGTLIPKGTKIRLDIGNGDSRNSSN
jgi:beta-lactam-binding protein with PASTA domain